jgi:hypothetical protein
MTADETNVTISRRDAEAQSMTENEMGTIVIKEYHDV